MGPNTVQMWTTAPLEYLLINVKAVILEKVSLSNMQNVWTVCEHIDCRSTYLFLKETNYRSQFRCNYLKNENLSLNFYVQFWNSDKIFNTLKKRRLSFLMYFRNYEFRKRLLDKCRKSRALEDLLTSDMVNGTKQCWNPNDTTFTIFVDHCQGN